MELRKEGQPPLVRMEKVGVGGGREVSKAPPPMETVAEAPIHVTVVSPKRPLAEVSGAPHDSSSSWFESPPFPSPEQRPQANVVEEDSPSTKLRNLPARGTRCARDLLFYAFLRSYISRFMHDSSLL